MSRVWKIEAMRARQPEEIRDLREVTGVWGEGRGKAVRFLEA